MDLKHQLGAQDRELEFSQVNPSLIIYEVCSLEQVSLPF